MNVVVSSDFPEKINHAKMGSPIVLGIGESEHLCSKRATPIVILEM